MSTGATSSPSAVVACARVERLEVDAGEDAVEVGRVGDRRGLEERVVVVPRREVAGGDAEAVGEPGVERALPCAERRRGRRRRRRRASRTAGARRARRCRARVRSGRASRARVRPRSAAGRARGAGRRRRRRRSSRPPTPRRRRAGVVAACAGSARSRCRRPRRRRARRGAGRIPTPPPPGARRSRGAARRAPGWGEPVVEHVELAGDQRGRGRRRRTRGADGAANASGSASTSETASSVGSSAGSVSGSASTAASHHADSAATTSGRSRDSSSVTRPSAPLMRGVYGATATGTRCAGSCGSSGAAAAPTSAPPNIRAKSGLKLVSAAEPNEEDAAPTSRIGGGDGEAVAPLLVVGDPNAPTTMPTHTRETPP